MSIVQTHRYPKTSKVMIMIVIDEASLGKCCENSLDQNRSVSIEIK